MSQAHKQAYIAALLTALAAAATLAGYELVRTPMQTLYKAEFGKQSLPMVMAGLPFSVAIVLYLYARILSAIGPRKTLLVTTIGSAVIVAASQLLYESGVKLAVVILYLYGTAYVVLLIEQYWSFLNSALTEGLARRLNGPICGVASFGSILGGVLGTALTSKVGTSGMVLIAAAATLPAAFFSDLAYRRSGEPKDRPKGEDGGAGVGSHLALQEFRSSRVLVLLLAIVVVTQVIAAFLSLSFQGVLQDSIPDMDAQTTYSYSFYAWLNGIAAVFQFVVAPLLMHFARPGIVHVLIPVANAVALLAFLRDPTLATIGAAYMCFKTLDYSIFRAAKEILYVPLPFDARYRAKEVIDVFGYRFSKGVTAGSITLLQNMGMKFAETGFALAGVITCGIWVALASLIGRFYVQRTVPHKADVVPSRA